jgi:hypothetical protein
MLLRTCQEFASVLNIAIRIKYSAKAGGSRVRPNVASASDVTFQGLRDLTDMASQWRAEKRRWL